MPRCRIDAVDTLQRDSCFSVNPVGRYMTRQVASGLLVTGRDLSRSVVNDTASGDIERIGVDVGIGREIPVWKT